MVAKTVVAEPQVSDGSVDHGAEVTPSLKRSAPQGIPKQGLLQDIPGGSVEPPTKPLDVCTTEETQADSLPAAV